MKKRGLLIALIFIIFSVFVTHAKAQEDTKAYEEAYKNYSLKLEEYEKARNEYILARSQYLRFQTQKSQSDARSAAIKFLQIRDEVVILHLTVLKERLAIAKGVSEPRRETLLLKISEEIDWYEDHKMILSSAGTLDEVVRDSNKAKDRFKTTSNLVYEILANVPYGRVVEFHDRVKDITSKIQAKLETIKTDTREGYSFSGQKFQVFDRWLLESQNLVVRGEEKSGSAEDQINFIAEGKGDPVNLYNKTVEDLTQSQQYLKDATSFLKELIREIKIAEN